jgi:hypothetical protein
MKKRSIFLGVLLWTLALFTAGAQEFPRGDVDRDGAVNISDVACLIDNLLAGVPEGDVDQEGDSNISDVTCLVDYLLSGSWPDNPVSPPVEGDWVDLGLPSGTLWATRNVGASAPEDYGDYFSWGETEPKDYYDWSTYKWLQEYQDAYGYCYSGYTKYCTYSYYGYNGFVDNKTELDPSDDAACAHYPGGRMPSLEQIQELIDNCTWQWTQRNGVNGQLGTGPNGNTIFLPAAGGRFDEPHSYLGSRDYYWSRTLNSGHPCRAYDLSFDPGDVYLANYDRPYGFPVRAVRVSQN